MSSKIVVRWSSTRTATVSTKSFSYIGNVIFLQYSRGSSARLLVTRKDFHAALQEFTPAYTQKEEDVLQEFLPRGYIKCGKPHDQVRFILVSFAENYLNLL